MKLRSIKFDQFNQVINEQSNQYFRACLQSHLRPHSSQNLSSDLIGRPENIIGGLSTFF